MVLLYFFLSLDGDFWLYDSGGLLVGRGGIVWWCFAAVRSLHVKYIRPDGLGGFGFSGIGRNRER